MTHAVQLAGENIDDHNPNISKNILAVTTLRYGLNKSRRACIGMHGRVNYTIMPTDLVTRLHHFKKNITKMWQSPPPSCVTSVYQPL